MSDRITTKNLRHQVNKPKANIQSQERTVTVSQEKRPEHSKWQKNNPLIQKIISFISSNHNFYLGFGGLGDAILLLATCWNDPKAKVIFFANQQPFMQLFFDLFNIPAFLHPNLMGTRQAGEIYDFVSKHRNFKQSAHLADGLYYGDWANETKYMSRIQTNVAWIEKFGKNSYPEPVLILAPSGSHRDVNRQRYLAPEEYRSLVNKYLDLNYRVFACGSLSDYHFYGNINRIKFSWLSADRIITHNNQTVKINLQQMLQVINSASLVISVDTWLKTYALLCKIPTIVVQTRWNGKYISYGEDITDWIFLNPNLWWTIKVERIENLL